MEIKLLPHQWDACHSPVKNTLLLGGVGSGKTYAGCYFVLKQLNDQPNAVGFIGANSYQQLRDVAISALLDFFNECNIEYTYNKNDSIIYVYGTKILCRSLDKYDNFRGIEIAWAWLDEIAYARREAFDVVVGRLRDKNASRHLTLLTTTPKGFNWLYDYFHPSGELNTPDYQMISASSYKNKHLPNGYIDSLKTQYDDNLIQQELMGEFVNLTQGRTYYAFDRDKHVKEFEPAKGFPYWCFADFNVDPMTGGAAQIINDVIYVYDERYLRNSDTFKFKDSMQDYWGSNIVPDSTGKARSTVGTSNHDILSQSFNVIYSHNPHVIDRVNNINRLLSMNKIIIHPKCKKLINDLEKVSWREGKNDLDQTTDKTLTHLSDGLGYLAFYLFPIRGRGSKANITFE